MKKLIKIIILFMLGNQAILAQNIQTNIENLERQRFAAQVSKDFDFLDNIFADDLVYTHSNGKQDTKSTYIASIKEGKSVYNKIDVEEIVVRVYSNDKTAVVNGKVMIEQTSADNKLVMLHLRYTAVYTKTGKKTWQLNTWQSLKLAN